MCNFFTKLDVSCFHNFFLNRSHFHNFKSSSCIIYETNPLFCTYNLQQTTCRYLKKCELVENGSLIRHTLYNAQPKVIATKYYIYLSWQVTVRYAWAINLPHTIYATWKPAYLILPIWRGRCIILISYAVCVLSIFSQ